MGNKKGENMNKINPNIKHHCWKPVEGYTLQIGFIATPTKYTSKGKRVKVTGYIRKDRRITLPFHCLR
jgi:hypothetical protein